MPRESTTYRAHFYSQTDKARALCPELGDKPVWIPKSVFLYYSNPGDGSGQVKFKVEGWKEREIEAAGFSEA